MEQALHIFKVLSICQIRYGEMLLKVLFSLVKHIVSVESQVVLLDEVLFFNFCEKLTWSLCGDKYMPWNGYSSIAEI